MKKEEIKQRIEEIKKQLVALVREQQNLVAVASRFVDNAEVLRKESAALKAQLAEKVEYVFGDYGRAKYGGKEIAWVHDESGCQAFMTSGVAVPYRKWFRESELTDIEWRGNIKDAKELTPLKEFKMGDGRTMHFKAAHDRTMQFAVARDKGKVYAEIRDDDGRFLTNFILPLSELSLNLRRMVAWQEHNG